MRDASTYRGARRNNILRKVKSTWGVEGSYHASFAPKRRRASFISKHPSKYMPHDDGGAYYETRPVFKPEGLSKWLGLNFRQVMHKMRGGK